MEEKSPAPIEEGHSSPEVEVIYTAGQSNQVSLTSAWQSAHCWTPELTSAMTATVGNKKARNISKGAAEPAAVNSQAPLAREIQVGKQKVTIYSSIEAALRSGPGSPVTSGPNSINSVGHAPSPSLLKEPVPVHAKNTLTAPLTTKHAVIAPMPTPTQHAVTMLRATENTATVTDTTQDTNTTPTTMQNTVTVSGTSEQKTIATIINVPDVNGNPQPSFQEASCHNKANPKLFKKSEQEPIVIAEITARSSAQKIASAVHNTVTVSGSSASSAYIQTTSNSDEKLQTESEKHVPNVESASASSVIFISESASIQSQQQQDLNIKKPRAPRKRAPKPKPKSDTIVSISNPAATTQNINSATSGPTRMTSPATHLLYVRQGTSSPGIVVTSQAELEARLKALHAQQTPMMRANTSLPLRGILSDPVRSIVVQPSRIPIRVPTTGSGNNHLTLVRPSCGPVVQTPITVPIANTSIPPRPTRPPPARKSRAKTANQPVAVSKASTVEVPRPPVIVTRNQPQIRSRVVTTTTSSQPQRPLVQIISQPRFVLAAARLPSTSTACFSTLSSPQGLFSSISNFVPTSSAIAVQGTMMANAQARNTFQQNSRTSTSTLALVNGQYVLADGRSINIPGASSFSQVLSTQVPRNTLKGQSTVTIDQFKQFQAQQQSQAGVQMNQHQNTSNLPSLVQMQTPTSMTQCSGILDTGVVSSHAEFTGHEDACSLRLELEELLELESCRDDLAMTMTTSVHPNTGLPTPSSTNPLLAFNIGTSMSQVEVASRGSLMHESQAMTFYTHDDNIADSPPQATLPSSGVVHFPASEIQSSTSLRGEGITLPPPAPAEQPSMSMTNVDTVIEDVISRTGIDSLLQDLPADSVVQKSPGLSASEKEKKTPIPRKSNPRKKKDTQVQAAQRIDLEPVGAVIGSPAVPGTRLPSFFSSFQSSSSSSLPLYDLKVTTGAMPSDSVTNPAPCIVAGEKSKRKLSRKKSSPVQASVAPIPAVSCTTANKEQLREPVSLEPSPASVIWAQKQILQANAAVDYESTSSPSPRLLSSGSAIPQVVVTPRAPNSSGHRHLAPTQSAQQVAISSNPLSPNIVSHCHESILNRLSSTPQDIRFSMNGDLLIERVSSTRAAENKSLQQSISASRVNSESIAAPRLQLTQDVNYPHSAQAQLVVRQPSPPSLKVIRHGGQFYQNQPGRILASPDVYQRSTTQEQIVRMATSQAGTGVIQLHSTQPQLELSPQGAVQPFSAPDLSDQLSASSRTPELVQLIKQGPALLTAAQWTAQGGLMAQPSPQQPTQLNSAPSAHQNVYMADQLGYTPLNDGGEEPATAETQRNDASMFPLPSLNNEYLDQLLLLQNISDSDQVPDMFLGENLFESVFNETAHQSTSTPLIAPVHVQQTDPDPVASQKPKKGTPRKSKSATNADAQSLIGSETVQGQANNVAETPKRKRIYVRKKDRLPANATSAPTLSKSSETAIPADSTSSMGSHSDKVKKPRKQKPRKNSDKSSTSTDADAGSVALITTGMDWPAEPPSVQLPLSNIAPALSFGGVPPGTEKPKKPRKPYVRKKKVEVATTDASVVTESGGQAPVPEALVQPSAVTSLQMKKPARSRKKKDPVGEVKPKTASDHGTVEQDSSAAFPLEGLSEVINRMYQQASARAGAPLPAPEQIRPSMPASAGVASSQQRSSVIQSTLNFIPHPPIPTNVLLAWNTSRFTSEKPLDHSLQPGPAETYTAALDPTTKTSKPTSRPRKPPTKKQASGTGTAPITYTSPNELDVGVPQVAGLIPSIPSTPTRERKRSPKKNPNQEQKLSEQVVSMVGASIAPELMDFVLNPPNSSPKRKQPSTSAQSNRVLIPVPLTSPTSDKASRSVIEVTPIMINPIQVPERTAEAPPQSSISEPELSSPLQSHFHALFKGLQSQKNEPQQELASNVAETELRKMVSSSSTCSIVISPPRLNSSSSMPSATAPEQPADSETDVTQPVLQHELPQVAAISQPSAAQTDSEMQAKSLTSSENNEKSEEQKLKLGSGHSRSGPSYVIPKRGRGRPLKYDDAHYRQTKVVQRKVITEKSVETGAGSRWPNPGFKWCYTREEQEFLYKEGGVLVNRKDFDLPSDQTHLWFIWDGGRGSVELQEYEPFVKESTQQLFHISNWQQPLKDGSIRKWGARRIRVDTPTELYQAYIPVYVTIMVQNSDMAVLKYHKENKKTLPYLMDIYISQTYVEWQYRDCLRTIIYQATDPSFVTEVILNTSNTTTLISKLRQSWAGIENLIKDGCVKILRCPKWQTGCWIQFMKYSRIAFTRKLVDKSKMCVMCMSHQHPPHRVVHFLEPLYNSHTLEQIPPEECDFSDRPAEGIQVCCSCTTIVRDFHSLYHARYHILACVQLRLHALLQTGIPKLKPTNFVEHVLSDIEWVEQMLLDFLLVLARARKDAELLTKWQPPSNPTTKTKSISPKKEKVKTEKVEKVKLKTEKIKKEKVQKENSGSDDKTKRGRPPRAPAQKLQALQSGSASHHESSDEDYDD